MGKRNPEISFEDFLEWVSNNPKESENLYYEVLLGEILRLEQDDYFGTEGFEKRFG